MIEQSDVPETGGKHQVMFQEFVSGTHQGRLE